MCSLYIYHGIFVLVMASTSWYLLAKNIQVKIPCTEKVKANFKKWQLFCSKSLSKLLKERSWLVLSRCIYFFDIFWFALCRISFCFYRDLVLGLHHIRVQKSRMRLNLNCALNWTMLYVLAKQKQAKTNSKKSKV